MKLSGALKIGYFRSYPWGLQLFLFLMMTLTLMWFASAMIIAVLPRFTPYSYGELATVTEPSPAGLIDTAITVQGFLSLLIFLAPALLFGYLSHPAPASYLGMRKPGKPIQWVLAVTMVLGAMPVLELFESLISLIDFGPKVKAMQAANDHMMSAFLQVPGGWSFFRTFAVLAIIPGLGEEFFFRGVLMRFVKQRVPGMLFPVLFTAVVFAFSHTNIYGLLSIFIAGVLLAVIYNLTGSIWCGVLAHIAFNGTQVILSYLATTNTAVKHIMSANQVPIGFVVAGSILFAASLYLLWKNRTPLPADWADNYKGERRPLETLDAAE